MFGPGPGHWTAFARPTEVQGKIHGFKLALEKLKNCDRPAQLLLYSELCLNRLLLFRLIYLHCKICFNSLRGGEWVYGSTDLALKSAQIVDFCGKSSSLADFENTVNHGSAVTFDADSGLCRSYVRILGPKRNLDHRSFFSLGRNVN